MNGKGNKVVTNNASIQYDQETLKKVFAPDNLLLFHRHSQLHLTYAYMLSASCQPLEIKCSNNNLHYDFVRFN